MSGVVVDTSVWIDFFAGREVPALEEALAGGFVVLPPLVVAELVSGARTRGAREAVEGLVVDFAVHPTPLEHWLHVGELRRKLREKGITISTPDAHIAQCALDRDAPLLTRDGVFLRVAETSRLRVISG